jgi:hypothetical protein
MRSPSLSTKLFTLFRLIFFEERALLESRLIDALARRKEQGPKIKTELAGLNSTFKSREGLLWDSWVEELTGQLSESKVSSLKIDSIFRSFGISLKPLLFGLSHFGISEILSRLRSSCSLIRLWAALPETFFPLIIGETKLQAAGRRAVG